MLFRSLYIKFFAKLEGNTIINGAKGKNFLFITRLLIHKLVAGTANDNQFVAHFLVKFLQFFVLRRIPAFAGSIDKQYFFALERSKIYWGDAVNRI